MTQAQALNTLKTTRKLNTAMLKPLGVTFEQFLSIAFTLALHAITTQDTP